MAASSVSVRVTRDGGVYVLSVRGELDIMTAPKVAELASGVISGQAERLVLDLGGLVFLDCAGARALQTVTECLPPGCPVVIRSMSLQARRLLQVIDLDLSQARPAPGGLQARRAVKLIQQAQRARVKSEELITRTLQAAEQMAAAEQNAAVTLSRLAAQRRWRRTGSSS